MKNKVSDMLSNINRHARDFRCDFTIEFDVKNPSVPDCVSEEDREHEMQTGDFTNAYCDEAFRKMLGAAPKSRRWEIEDWSFAGRSNGWFALMCRGEVSAVTVRQLEKLAAIANKFFSEYGAKFAETLAKEREEERAEAAAVREGAVRIPDGDRANFETMLLAAGRGRICLVRARRKSDGAYVSLVCAANDLGDEISIVPFAMMLGADGNPYEQFVPAPDPDF